MTVSAIHDRLRRATRASHERLEAIVDVTRAARTPEGYRRLLAALIGSSYNPATLVRRGTAAGGPARGRPIARSQGCSTRLGLIPGAGPRVVIDLVEGKADPEACQPHRA